MTQERDRYIDAQANQYMDAVRESGRRSREQIGRVVEEAAGRMFRRQRRSHDPVDYLADDIRAELVDLSQQISGISRQIQDRITDLDSFVKEYTRHGRTEIVETPRAYGAWREQSLFGVPAARAASGADRASDVVDLPVDEAGRETPRPGA